MIELFFLGDGFYKLSQSSISSIYEVGTNKRWDWAMVELALGRGEEIHIRFATQQEMIWANRRAEEIKC